LLAFVFDIVPHIDAALLRKRDGWKNGYDMLGGQNE
jgi:hypothetical protein